MVDSIILNGLRGVQMGQASAAENADRASKAFLPEGDGDLVTPLVGLATDKVQVEASAKVIKVGEDLDRTILDILA